MSPVINRQTCLHSPLGEAMAVVLCCGDGETSGANCCVRGNVLPGHCCAAMRCALLRHSSQFENTFFKSYIFANKMTKKRGGLEDVKKERSVLDVEVSVFNAACRWFIQPHLSLHSHSIVEQSRQFILSAPLR